MRRFIHRRHSIYVQMLFLLITAAVTAGIFFLMMDKTGEYLLDWYMEKSNYAEIRNRKEVDELQDYITANSIFSRDEELIGKWVRMKRLLSVSIYKDGIQVFDSDYPNQQIWNEEIVMADYDWIRYDAVVFEDGVAEIMISGAWRYQLYSYIHLFEMSFCFFVFLLIVLLGIRKKMRYIRQLSNEVEVLEGGGLDCPITVKGFDELSVLAEGLDSMRKSFLEGRTREAEIVRDHQRVITEMSHDLRTPVTSIMLYAEILLTGKSKDENQKRQYIEKINKKALQIKERTDSLLKYSLGTCGDEVLKMENGSLSEAFYDLLSETCGYLEQRGFQMDVHVRWPEGQICYNTDYTVRIMDNIMSNIVKYADRMSPIAVKQVERINEIGLLFRNRIALFDESAEGTGIGIQSIQNMMKEMNGICRSGYEDMAFWVEIVFPVKKPCVGPDS